MACTIDIKDYVPQHVPVLVGRKNGETLVEKLAAKGITWNALEATEDTIEIIVPERIETMNGSYFLGAWGNRVRALGGAAAFFAKYHFHASPHIVDAIHLHAERAMVMGSQVDILLAKGEGKDG